MFSDGFSTWLEIDLSAIQNNIRQVHAITKKPVMAVIKANAYGHGLVEVGRSIAASEAAWCGVARLEEALALRAAGVDLPILVMGYTDPARVPDAISADVQLTVYQMEIAQHYAAQARSFGSRLSVHAKLDSGMGRLGVFAEEGPGFISALADCKELDVAGVFTHFARADESGQAMTDRQIDRFSKAVAELESAGLRPPLVHASNSAACLYHPRAWFDLVRPGIAIYGLHPSPNAPLPERFRPALSWKARLVSVKDLPPASGVSYGHRYITQKTEHIGVIPVGYADGFRRQTGNTVLVGGQRVPVVGTICMDQFMVQLDTVPQARSGDEVVLIGRQGDAVITAEDLGQVWGTINYEVVCGLAARLPRIYL